MFKMSRLLTLLLLVVCLATIATVCKADETATANDDMSDEDRLAEEMAAAAVEEAAEEEEEDDADALDEEADAARLDSGKHPLTDMPPAADDVLVAHAFEGMEGEVLTLGETIKTVIAFANEGRMQYHVWGVMGSLNKRHDIFVQNFTYSVVNKTVYAGDELSFSYMFTPNERLDPTMFQLSLNVFYEAQGATGNAIRGHSTTFYNVTVDTRPGKESMSNGLFMVLFTLFVIAVSIFIWFLRLNSEKKEVEMGTTAKPDRNEWLEEHHTMARTGGGRVRNRSTAK